MQGSVCAHEYEDGFIERSLTITIRDGVGYGEYQIGLNAKTAEQIVELAEQQQQEKLPQQTKEEKPASRALLAREKSLRAATNQVKDSDSSLPIEPELKASAPIPVGEHLTDLATIKRFDELRQHWFSGRLNLTSDGQPVELSKVTVEPAARHPYSVLVKFQFRLSTKRTTEETTQDVPLALVEGLSAGKPKATIEPESLSSRSVDFLVTDRLFLGYHGATRYALRSRGATMLLQSNVAPALVRAERAELDRDAARAILAERLPVIRAKLSIGSR